MSTPDSRTHVLLAIAGLSHGGAERVVANLCRFLDPGFFRVSVYWHVALGSIGEELRGAGVPLYGFPEAHPTWSRYRRFQYLRELIRVHDVDIVHSHDISCLIDATQARALLPVRHIHTFHYGNYPNLKPRYLWLERLFSRGPHRLVAVGTEQRKTIERALRIRPGRIATIDNGVAAPTGRVDEALLRPYVGGAGRPPIVGSISTLTDQKGLPYLLETARILKDRGCEYLFLVAGDGPLRPQLERRARDLGVEASVRFLGWVPAAASQLLPAFDVFVQPSLWEANSMVLLEAMAAGRPIVTTDVGENRHVVDNGRSGYVVPPRDPLAFANRLIDLLASEERRRAFGQAAQAKFASRYTLDAMIHRYAKLYDELRQ